jgi:hypothetical protein
MSNSKLARKWTKKDLEKLITDGAACLEMCSMVDKIVSSSRPQVVSEHSDSAHIQTALVNAVIQISGLFQKRVKLTLNCVIY